VFAQVIQSFHPQQLRQQAQAEKRWETYEFRDVFGSTWVIYGLGHIGAELARRAQAFGVHVIGCRRTPVGDEPVDQMVRPDELLDVLPQADVVVLTAALSDENHHIVNTQFLELLQPGATLVNIGRGGLVDEAALLSSLEKAKPATAILDVFETEPLPEDSPFWEHPRVQLTAHCAGASDGTSWRGDQQFLDNLGRFLDGRPLAMQVSELR
jgi:phosphoglycerate dehydrogenase-like enzyme